MLLMKRFTRYLGFFLVIQLVIATQLALGAAISSQTIDSLVSRYDLHNASSLRWLYREAEGKPLWGDDENFSQLLSAIQASWLHGLNPETYHYTKLQVESLDLTEKDILASDAFILLGLHLSQGQVDPVDFEPTWNLAREQKNIAPNLLGALKEANVQHRLESFAPKQPRYMMLKKALLKYEQIASQGGWPKVPAGPALKSGSDSARVVILRQRLIASSDLNSTVVDTELQSTFDADVEAALKRFQRRANLEPDGVLGPKTLAQLNYDAQYRVEQIKVNLERWRWLPEELGRRHIRVNIADYRVELYEQSEVQRVHDAVIGKTYRKTPVFSATMKYLVLNPWWETPMKIARKDLLPKFIQNPSMVDDMGYVVSDGAGKLLGASSINWKEIQRDNLPFRLRQKPGDKNALGVVKFMFPNKYDVYLHDTSAKDLFSKTQRDFSSGCIRVKDPVDLIEWALSSDTQWGRAEIDRELALGKEKRISLISEIPVHILYWTVVDDDHKDGDIRFINDIYERDQKLKQALVKMK